MTSKKVLRDGIKALWMEKVSAWLRECGEDALVFGSNKIAIPVVDAEGGEDWLTFTLTVPTGSRDGDVFDGYEMARDWEMTQKEKAEKRAEKEKEKEKKKERDEKARNAKKAKKEEGDVQSPFLFFIIIIIL